MKLIDFHTHAFPDAIAQRAMESLQQGARDSGTGFEDTFYADGTFDGLVGLMDRSGVDKSVLFSVATKPSQPAAINPWLKGLADSCDRIIPFGAVYPDEGALRTLEDIVQLGFKGIKLHGDFQHFYIDEERMLPIYRRCGELGLIVMLHMGMDFCSVNDYHATPERLVNVLDKISDTKFVAAHMGGVCCEERAVKILPGAENVWVDTGYTVTAGRISPEMMGGLIEAFGADRVLFASDSPWNDPADNFRLISGSGISHEDLELICHKNAEKLLGIG